MSEDLHFEEFIPAPRERVFAYFAEHENLGRLWGGRWKRIKAGQDPKDPNGVGSVREIKAGAFRFEETIVTYQPHQLIEYKMTNGPVKDHFARIALSDQPGGTHVDYAIRFDSKFPGTGRMFAATLRLSWTIGMRRVIRFITEEA